jgi:hypothetical protein
MTILAGVYQSQLSLVCTKSTISMSRHPRSMRIVLASGLHETQVAMLAQ